VKLFDSNNNSIFNESYVLDPEKEIKSQYPARLITGTSIDVTLNNDITRTETVYSNLSDTDIIYELIPKPDLTSLLLLTLQLPDMIFL
jgi:hypothetical protein